MIFSGGQWALTNVKLTVGCSKMLLYDGIDCQKCVEGYYPVRNSNKTISRCDICPIQCKLCTDATACTSCANGYQLQGGKCTNSYNTTVLQTGNKIAVCDNRTFTMSDTIDGE